MDTINAAMLLVSFKYFKNKTKKLMKIRKYYDENINDIIVKQKIRKYEIPGMYAYPLQIKNRNNVKKFLEKKGIETKIWNDPLISDSPAYKSKKNGKLVNAKRILKHTLNIPFHEKLSKKQLKYIVENLNLSIRKFS